VDLKAILIFTLLFAVSLGYSRWKKKNLSPIVLVIVSAVLGGLLYGI